MVSGIFQPQLARCLFPTRHTQWMPRDSVRANTIFLCECGNAQQSMYFTYHWKKKEPSTSTRNALASKLQVPNLYFPPVRAISFFPDALFPVGCGNRPSTSCVAFGARASSVSLGPVRSGLPGGSHKSPGALRTLRPW